MARSPFRVALTFDAEHPDRPSRVGATGRVLETLADRGVQASFFVQGRWATACPDVARSLVEGGHLIGNHSFYHAPMPALSPAALDADVRAAERAILQVTGVDPRPWFRCPFGAGSHDEAILGRLSRLGYRETRWDVDGSDWRPRTSARRLIRSVLDGAVEHGDGTVVLLHPWTTAADRGLASILDGLRSAGATFVRLDDLS